MNKIPSSENKQKKRIIISIDRQPLKHKNLFNSQTTPQNPLPTSTPTITAQSDLQKLLNISQRCQSSYSQYHKDHEREISQMQLMFAELEQFVQQTFLRIFENLQAKKDQFKLLIQKKKQEFFMITKQQHSNVTDCINRVIQKDMYFCNHGMEIQANSMAEFAANLSSFYEKMQAIEKIDVISEIVNFSHQFRTKIQEQAQGHSHNRQDNQNATISFSNVHIFDKDGKEQRIQVDLDEILTQQAKRQVKIKFYPEKIRENFLIY